MQDTSSRRIDILMVCPDEDWICRQFIERCREDAEAAKVLRWHLPAPGQLDDTTLGRAEIIVGGLPEGWRTKARRLRWVQFLGAGMEGALTPELVSSDVVITNASGVHAVPISEHVTAMVLMFVRALKRCVCQQVKHEWNREGFEDHVTELCSSTMGVVGLGAIGEAVAERAKALGMRVIATRRHPDRPSEFVDQLYSPDQLPDLLRQSDFIAICTPLTHETRGMIGAEQIRIMKSDAFIVNIARGAIIDQDALVAALQEGRIGGAGLDVTDPEPLPSDSPLWDMPNVIISPHIAGLTPIYGRRAADIFLRNLQHYLRGDIEGMPTLVDRHLGY